MAVTPPSIRKSAPTTVLPEGPGTQRLMPSGVVACLRVESCPGWAQARKACLPWRDRSERSLLRNRRLSQEPSLAPTARYVHEFSEWVPDCPTVARDGGRCDLGRRA